MRDRLIGHNSRHATDDEGPSARKNVGRTISAKNEKKIRDASASIAAADSNLIDVLSALDKEVEKEESG